MPTPESADELDPDELAVIEARILAQAEDPATDPAEFERLTAQAIRAMETGVAGRRGAEVRLRITGPGVPGHDVPVHLAAQILDGLQGVVRYVGGAIRNAQETARGGRPRAAVGIRRATELRLSSTIGAGSVVFFLEGPPEPITGGEFPGTTDTDTLIDTAVKRLFGVVEAAQADTADAIGELTQEMQRLGVQAASKLNQIAEQTLANSVELDLGLRSPSGRRSSVILRSRGATAIKDAVERARHRVESVIMLGRLNTVSDGSDMLRLTLDDERVVRMSVEPEVGISLGQLLGKRVSADVAVTITWHTATGKETRKYQLLEATPIDAQETS